MSSTLTKRSAFLLATLAVASCLDFETETFTGRVGSLTPLGAMTAGDTVQFRTYAEFENSELVLRRFESDKYPGDWKWVSSIPAVATVDTLGVVRALALGTTRLTATFRDVAATLDLQVIPVVDAVVLSATADTVDLNGSVSFDATALDSQNQAIPTVPLTAIVTSNSGNMLVSLQRIATGTRFTVTAKGGVTSAIVIKSVNVRTNRERSATINLYINP